jgi:sugar/nucleoside kinase (ribokinase family)
MISIKVEVASSTKLKEAIYEALDLANRLNINVSFDFNGIPMLVFPTCDIVTASALLELSYNSKRELRILDHEDLFKFEE